MAVLFWLSKVQVDRMSPYFPRPRGIARVDDLPVLSGILPLVRNGLRWRDAPPEYGPHKSLMNGSCAGPVLVCSPISSAISLERLNCPTG